MCQSSSAANKAPYCTTRWAINLPYRAWVAGLILLLCHPGIKQASARENQPTALGGKYGLSMDINGEYKPSDLGITANPWYRYVYHKEQDPLWDGLYLEGGGLFMLNPAYGQAGAYLEWMPITILQLHVQLDRYLFFGQYGALMAFDDRNARFGDRALRTHQGKEMTGDANRLLLQPTFTLTAGRMVLSNETDYAFYSFEPNDAQTGAYFWELEYDTLLKKRDRLIADTLSLLYEFDPGKKQSLLIGPYYEVVHAYGSRLTRQRMGISFDYELPTGHGRWQRPRLYLQTGANVQDRNAQGQLYLVGGIGADFDMN